MVFRRPARVTANTLARYRHVHRTASDLCRRWFGEDSGRQPGRRRPEHPLWTAQARPVRPRSSRSTPPRPRPRRPESLVAEKLRRGYTEDATAVPEAPQATVVDEDHFRMPPAGCAAFHPRRGGGCRCRSNGPTRTRAVQGRRDAGRLPAGDPRHPGEDLRPGDRRRRARPTWRANAGSTPLGAATVAEVVGTYHERGATRPTLSPSPTSGWRSGAWCSRRWRWPR